MLAKRIHLVEIEDLSFCPRPLRDGITDILQFSINRRNVYAPIVPLLVDAIRRSDAQRIVDLCSGGGGPWPSLMPGLREELGSGFQVMLTDLFPNHKAFARTRELLGDGVNYELESVSAFDVPPGLAGFRTIFTGFHHFRPADGQKVLQDAVRKGEGIAIFEFTHRSFKGLLMPLLAPIATLLLVPFIKPFRWSRMLLTYLVPLLPLCTLFDGVVSCLRTYSTAELQAMVDRLPENNYAWQIGEQAGAGGPLTYLVGYPAAS